MMKFGRMFAVSALFLCCAAAVADGPVLTSETTKPKLTGPLVNEPVVGTVYRCYKQEDGSPTQCWILHPDGTMTPVINAVATEEVDWQTFLALARAAKTGADTPILGDSGVSGPIEACANTHGASACCRIIRTMPDLGAVDIFCP